MRVISEKTLRQIAEGCCDSRIKSEINYLIEYECTELNPWMPIENAPMNRSLLLLTIEYGKQVGKWFETSYGGWWVVACMPVTPTHYQELPEAPL